MLRWLLCLLLLLPVTLPSLLRHRGALLRARRLIVLLGLTGIAGFHTMVYQALTLTSAVNVLLILSLAPVLTAVGVAIWNGYRLGPAQVGGLVLSACGGGVVLLFGSDGGAGVGEIDLGALWMLGAIVFWTAYSLLLRRRPPSLPQDVTLAATVLVGIAAMAVPMLFLGVQPISLTWPSAAAVLYIAVFASLLGFLLWSWGPTRIGSERAGQFRHLMPIFGTFWRFCCWESACCRCTGSAPCSPLAASPWSTEEWDAFAQVEIRPILMITGPARRHTAFEAMS